METPASEQHTDEGTAEEVILMERDLGAVPQRLAEERGPTCLVLNLKENRLTDFSNLALFTRLETLVLDKNGLSSLDGFPTMKTLKTLWLNNNKIADLQRFSEAAASLFPSLEYLSLMQNPACPSLLESEEEDKVARYRNLLIFRLTRLQHLDFTDVSAAEREEAEKRGPFLVVRRPTPQKPRKASKSSAGGGSDITPARRASDLRKPTAILGMSGPKRYDGSQSEGNRFIQNHDL